MDWNFSDLSNFFSARDRISLLKTGTWGLERESQRVTSSGDLALTPHPEAFEDKLENPCVTTDFSESQLELVTPPFKTVEDMYSYLLNLQSEVQQELKDELLWPLSMPPRLPDEEDIPIARFSNTLEGREKEIYRNGLALRYGKKMQMISGIHYNFSFSDEMLEKLYSQFGESRDKRDFTNNLYFSVARNYLRYRWLLIYLFGASPIADDTYNPVINKELSKVLQCCPKCCNAVDAFEEYATSLRVSRFGYSNTEQGKDIVSFDNLESYIRDIRTLMTTKSKKFAELGVFSQGRQLQLNDYILQKESEFYSSIRFKQITSAGETQLDALDKRGVKYLEVRILDVNPFYKAGISLEQLHFLQVFMLFCLFNQSDYFTASELDKVSVNHHLVALSGRKPGLKLLNYNNKTVALKSWGIEIFAGLKAIAGLMDKGSGSTTYTQSINNEYAKLMNPELLPSSQIYKEILEKNESFLDFGIRYALMHKYSENSIQCTVPQAVYSLV